MAVNVLRSRIEGQDATMGSHEPPTRSPAYFRRSSASQFMTTVVVPNDWPSIGLTT